MLLANQKDWSYRFYCSNPDCEKADEGFLSHEGRRCPVCREPAKLPEDLSILEVTRALGGTPFIDNEKLSDFAGAKNLYLKDEGENPSGSFKDRGSITAYLFHILQALREGKGAKELVIGTVSTGNMAISTTWMGNKLGIENFVVVHKETSPEKLAMIEEAAGEKGTTTFLVNGDYSKFHQRVYDACSNLRKKNRTVFAELTDDIFRILGYSALFEEMFVHCRKKGVSPDYVIVPGASGALFRVAVWTVENLKKEGVIREVPKVVLVQESGGDPIVQGYKRGLETSPVIRLKRDLVAGAINVANSRSGSAALRVLSEGEHLCVSVSSDEIIKAQDVLCKEGIFAQAASASSLAAVRRLKKDGVLSRDDTLVCVLTGKLVEQRKLGKNVGNSRRVNCTVDTLTETIENEFKN